MCSSPNVYMFFYLLIETHMVPLIMIDSTVQNIDM